MLHKKISFENAYLLAKEFNLNLNVIPIKWWCKALQVELEHGKGLDPLHSKTNVTNDDLRLTAKIALAHLLEYPDYYQRLDKMEKEAEEYWKLRKKPSVIEYNDQK